MLEKINSPDVKPISKEEGYIHTLRGLISYHERMTMFAYPERDFYLEALRYALKAVEEKIERENMARRGES